MPRWTFEQKIPVGHRDHRRTIMDVFTDGIEGIPVKQLSSFEPLNSGSSIGGHYHNEMGEVYYILSGEGTMKLKDVETDEATVVPVKAGSRIIIPPKIAHELRANTQMTLLIAATAPQGTDTIEYRFH